jgi:hypothetical protein
MTAKPIAEEVWQPATDEACWQLPVIQGFRGWATSGFPKAGLGTFLAFWQLNRSGAQQEWVDKFLPPCRRLAEVCSNWSTTAEAVAAIMEVAPEARFLVRRKRKDGSDRAVERTPWSALSKAAFSLRPDLVVIDDSLVRNALNIPDNRRISGVATAFEDLWRSACGARARSQAMQISHSFLTWDTLADWRSPDMLGRRILDCALMEVGRRTRAARAARQSTTVK